jgi:hypothetical protein
MNSQGIIARLRENQAELHAAWRMPRCSARAHDDAGPDSDTDIMIEIDPAARVILFDYMSD